MPSPRVLLAAVVLPLLLLGPPVGAAGPEVARERTVDLRADRYQLANGATFEIGQGDGWPGRAVLVRAASIGARGKGVADLGVQLDYRGLKARNGIGTLQGRRALGFAPRATRAGVRASTDYLAVPGTTTLRMLVRVANPADAARTIRLGIVTGLPLYREVAASSSGDRRFTTADRTLTTASSRRIDDDAVLTQVFAGPGSSAPRIRAEVTRSDYTTLDTRVRVPAGATRYFLFYADIAPDRAAARRQLGAFDGRRPSARLLTGLSPAVQRRTVNWDL